MTVYETICIIKTTLTDEEMGKLIAKVRGFIEKAGGEILKMENWGKKKMAYEVRKEKKGAYVFFRFRGPSPVVSELERQYRLEDAIIKFLTIKCDPKMLAEEMAREGAAAGHAALPAPVAVAVASPESSVGRCAMASFNKVILMGNLTKDPEVRFTPSGTPVATFTHAATELSRLGLAYLHVLEGLPGHWSHVPDEQVTPHLRKAFHGPLIVNAGYDATAAQRAITAGETDLVAFGVPLLANPDFVERVRRSAPLNPPDMATFYSQGPKGYTDYPALAVA